MTWRDKVALFNDMIRSGTEFEVRHVPKNKEVRVFSVVEAQLAKTEDQTNIGLVCKSAAEEKRLEVFVVTPVALESLRIYKKIYV